MGLGFEERFWKYVEKRGSDECWPWIGGFYPQGYGALGGVVIHGVKKTSHGAHRVSFFVANGYWPHVARHMCDHKWCVNPGHILDGTHQDNTNDMMKRGRFRGNGLKEWTHCKYGHEFTPENTYRKPGNTQRRCLTASGRRSARGGRNVARLASR